MAEGWNDGEEDNSKEKWKDYLEDVGWLAGHFVGVEVSFVAD